MGEDKMYPRGHMEFRERIESFFKNKVQASSPPSQLFDLGRRITPSRQNCTFVSRLLTSTRLVEHENSRSANEA